jgi:hypothetical protein
LAFLGHKKRAQTPQKSRADPKKFAAHFFAKLILNENHVLDILTFSKTRPKTSRISAICPRSRLFHSVIDCMLFFWMILRALTRSPVVMAAAVLALRQRLAIYRLAIFSGQPRRADRRPGFFRRADEHVSVALRVSGSVARPPPRAALRRYRASDFGLDRPAADRSLSV